MLSSFSGFLDLEAICVVLYCKRRIDGARKANYCRSGIKTLWQSHCIPRVLRKWNGEMASSGPFWANPASSRSDTPRAIIIKQMQQGCNSLGRYALAVKKSICGPSPPAYQHADNFSPVMTPKSINIRIIFTDILLSLCWFHGTWLFTWVLTSWACQPANRSPSQGWPIVVPMAPSHSGVMCSWTTLLHVAKLNSYLKLR